MGKQYDAIVRFSLNGDIDYLHTGELPELVHLDDPAQDAMVDFKHVRAMTIDADAPLRHARFEMQACGVHMLLVTNHQKQITGIISSEAILGEKPIKISQEKFITRDEIKVRMIMQNLDTILAIPYDEINLAKIGNIVQTMKDHRKHHILVVESSESVSPFVRGLFSLSNISRQLHTNLIDAELMATSLADLQDKIEKL